MKAVQKKDMYESGLYIIMLQESTKAISLLTDEWLRRNLKFMHQYDIVVVNTINGPTPKRKNDSLIMIKLISVCANRQSLQSLMFQHLHHIITLQLVNLTYIAIDQGIFYHILSFTILLLRVNRVEKNHQVTTRNKGILH